MSSTQYSIYIADDEPLAIDSIKVLLSTVPDCKIIGEANNGKDAFQQITLLNPDIVFMDIQMPHLTGMDVLEKLNQRGAPFFILVTAYEDQALKAYELNATDYLLKPYSDERFYQSLSKAREHVNLYSLQGKLAELDNALQKTSPKQYPSLFTIKSPGKVKFLAVEDLSYVQASGNYVEFVTDNNKVLSRTSLSDVEKQLDPNLFIRIHRSSIVRKSAIEELQSYFNGEYIVIMKNGEQLKLSRSYKENLVT